MMNVNFVLSIEMREAVWKAALRIFCIQSADSTSMK